MLSWESDMPQQTSVTITANADGSYNLQVGPYGFQGQQSDLFVRAFAQDHLNNNLRLAYLIGGYASPISQEFINGINQTLGGIKLADQSYYIVTFTQNADGTYALGAANAPGATQATFGFQVSLSDWTDTQQASVIVASVASFLRLRGSTGPTLSAADVTAINARKFWY